MTGDSEIIELFFNRSEDALTETESRYGTLCRKIAYGILKNREDSEECLNSARLSLWNSIPPARPRSLCAYLCAVVRNTAFELYNKNKRHYCEESFEELEQLIADSSDVDRLSDGIELSQLLNSFLEETKPINRKIFMARYYYNMSVNEIALRFSMSESAVKTRLSRIRASLRDYLSERGVIYG